MSYYMKCFADIQARNSVFFTVIDGNDELLGDVCEGIGGGMSSPEIKLFFRDRYVVFKMLPRAFIDQPLHDLRKDR